MGAAEGVRGCACGRALGALPSVCPRRTRGGLLLPVFNGLFGRLSVQISAKILCTVSSLHHILSFLCEFQAKIWSGLRDIGVCEVGSVRAVEIETKIVPSRVNRIRVEFKFFQGVLGVFRRQFVNWAIWF
jgi:hypothetical protein